MSRWAAAPDRGVRSTTAPLRIRRVGGARRVRKRAFGGRWRCHHSAGRAGRASEEAVGASEVAAFWRGHLVAHDAARRAVAGRAPREVEAGVIRLTAGLPGLGAGSLAAREPRLLDASAGEVAAAALALRLALPKEADAGAVLRGQPGLLLVSDAGTLRDAVDSVTAEAAGHLAEAAEARGLWGAAESTAAREGPSAFELAAEVEERGDEILERCGWPEPLPPPKRRSTGTFVMSAKVRRLGELVTWVDPGDVTAAERSLLWRDIDELEQLWLGLYRSAQAGGWSGEVRGWDAAAVGAALAGASALPHRAARLEILQRAEAGGASASEVLSMPEAALAEAFGEALASRVPRVSAPAGDADGGSSALAARLHSS